MRPPGGRLNTTRADPPAGLGGAPLRAEAFPAWAPIARGRSRTALVAINGAGQGKLDRCGATVLETVAGA